jgi:hypothetical protein
MIIVVNELPLTTHITASFGNGGPAVLARLLLFRRTHAPFGPLARIRRGEAAA